MLNIYQIATNSRIYGPDLRTVIWFQGCSIQCKGCINPHLWSFDDRRLMTIDEVKKAVVNNHVTFLGGEPLDQPEILELIKELVGNDIGIILFTGYSYKKLAGEKLECANLCDVVISEPFELKHMNPRLYLRGSENQIIRINSNRYQFSDFDKVESVEVIIGNSVEIHGRTTEDFVWNLLNN